MGNCQAVEASALEIKLPCGKTERLYWPVKASEVMRTYPGHHVSLIMPLPLPQGDNQEQVYKLLRPDETLTLGHAYRLITTQEVVKVLKARKRARTRKPQAKVVKSMQIMHMEEEASSTCDTGMKYQVNSAAQRPKSWRPSLQSISESGSSVVLACD